jgi:hypothetical protein
MKEYPCELCGKMFKQKSHWVQHTQNKKYSCVKKEELNIIKEDIDKVREEERGIGDEKKGERKEEGGFREEEEVKKNCCRFCLKTFTRSDNLKRHIANEKCEVLRLQKQQKENIFINLLEEDKIIAQTKKELNDNLDNIDEQPYKKENSKKESVGQDENINQIEFLITQIKMLNDKLELQKKESENKFEKELEKYRIETANKIKNELELERNKIKTEERLKLMSERYVELEKNNKELKKTNEKLQTKVNKIVNKNTQNITNNTIINNNGVKLVNFGSEDLDKISHNVFIETIRSQGAGLYNKAIEGIHFNKDYPENQNIYISDINRGKVMIYKDEKWFLDNWDSQENIIIIFSGAP